MKFYHGSQHCFPIGSVLRPTGGRRHLDPILDKARPAGAVSRAKAVFATDNIADVERAGGHQDYIYEIEPLGRVSGPHNGGWLWSVLMTEMKIRDARQSSTRNRYRQQESTLIRKYWAGAAGDRDDAGTMEYLLEGGARIVRIVRPRGAIGCKGQHKRSLPERILAESASEAEVDGRPPQGQNAERMARQRKRSRVVAVVVEENPTPLVWGLIALGAVGLGVATYAIVKATQAAPVSSNVNGPLTPLNSGGTQSTGQQNSNVQLPTANQIISNTLPQQYQQQANDLYNQGTNAVNNPGSLVPTDNTDTGS